MTISSTRDILREKINDKADYLSQALRYCADLPMLQTNKLTGLSSVAYEALSINGELAAAKALRKRLIACAEEITQRPRLPIEEVASAIEKYKRGLGSQELARLQKAVGVPFSRSQIDLARYYSIRLMMQGIDQGAISDFLNVDLRTVANYIAQAKKRIWLTLES
ncbi:MAG: hypothetical protein PHY28_09600 [Dehalococcoidales bacterium]|nr:hypothetical protein [Dehalococcoidales bacterium]